MQFLQKIRFMRRPTRKARMAERMVQETLKNKSRRICTEERLNAKPLGCSVMTYIFRPFGPKKSFQNSRPIRGPSKFFQLFLGAFFLFRQQFQEIRRRDETTAVFPTEGIYRLHYFAFPSIQHNSSPLIPQYGLFTIRPFSLPVKPFGALLPHSSHDEINDGENQNAEHRAREGTEKRRGHEVFELQNAFAALFRLLFAIAAAEGKRTDTVHAPARILDVYVAVFRQIIEHLRQRFRGDAPLFGKSRKKILFGKNFVRSRRTKIVDGL